MTLPKVVTATWISSNRFSSRSYDVAVSLSQSERFLESNQILIELLENNIRSNSEESVAAENLLILYGWNLIFQKNYAELEEFMGQLSPDIFEEYPSIYVLGMWIDVHKGRFSVVVDKCSKFELKNYDPIPQIFTDVVFIKGIAKYGLGDVDSSLECMEICNALSMLRKDDRQAALACNYLGFLYSRMSSYRISLDWLNRARIYFEKSDLRRKISMVNLNIGITHYKIGDYSNAFACLNQSLEIGVTSELPHRQCFANIALGNVYRLTRDYEAARKHLHTAYQQAQDLQFPREEALALEFLGDVYRDDGAPREARRFYARAMAIGERIAPEGDIVMEVHRRVGECLHLEGDQGAALIALNKSLAMARAQGDRFEEAVALRNISDTTLESGDLKSARKYINESVQILEEIEARHEHAISLMASATLALQEVEDPRTSTPRIVRLNEAWKQSTMALDLFIKVDVRWWTERGRALVSRVSAIRNAQEKSDREMMAGSVGGKIGAYNPGNVIIYKSNVMRDMLQLCDMFASTDEPVLITGETGTGKEVVAKRLHQHSNRAHRPLVIVNVAAIPATMFEREFFGHVKGAFSGAVSNGEGFAGQANGGTLFLDEIGDLPLELQPKLLRLIQERTYQALGDPKQRTTDLRLVAATNANLEEKVKDGTFRADLYYRLCTLDLPLPAVRDRSDDILPLMRHFLCEAIGQPVDLASYFNRASLDAMEEYQWPGNVREIAMVARQAHVSLTALGRVEVNIRRFDGDDLKLTSQVLKKMQAGVTEEVTREPESQLSQSDLVERSRILIALEEAGENRNDAAKALGIGRSTLYRKMEKYGIPTRRN